MNRHKKIVLSLVAAVLFTVIGYATYFAYSIYHFTSAISASKGNSEEIKELQIPNTQENLNILVVGVDNGQYDDGFHSGPGRTDAIMIVSINKEENKVSLLSVPRDTYLNIPGRGMDKVNHAYAYGGINLSIKALSAFLQIPIHHYFIIDKQAFTNAIDAVGGVNINVTEDVVYYIDGKTKVPKGLQKMDGKMAFDYVRTREGDIARIGRQQTFVKALAEQALTLSNILKIPEILNSTASDIQTDMTPKEIMEMAMGMRSMSEGNMHNETVPGHSDMLNGVSYWFPDVAGTKQIVQKVFAH